MRPAPQGRGYRVRKRSNHVTVIVDAFGGMIPAAIESAVEEAVVEAPKKAAAKKTKKVD
jgi:large subunit ribosomal protein L22